jgi:hypothetical protein
MKNIMLLCTIHFFLLGSLMLCCQKERVPKSLSYTVESVKDSAAVKSAETTCTIDISYPNFTDPNPIADSLNKYIQQTLCLTLQGDIYPSVQEFATHIFNEYKSFASDMPNFLTSWEYTSVCKINYENEKTISLVLDLYSYTGGAHGSYSVIVASFDKERAQPLLLDTILQSHSKEKLVRIAEEIFRKDQNMSSTDDLEKFGFWFRNNKFYLPENFSFTETGLFFFFNLYEIAPYSAGTFEVVVPYEKINPILLAHFHK